MRMIPYGRQSISEEDIAAVSDVLRSDWLTQGPTIERFEEGLAQYCGAQHGVALCNATAALHVACMTLGLGPGDLLWTSPNTFVASANCARYCGADIDFVDIDPDTYNMSVSELSNKLKQASKAGRLPKIVIPVHFAGQSCDMQGIAQLAKQYGFAVIEDASHAVGADYLGQKVGNCRYSDITVFSFHPVKILTTGEGGMILLNRTDLHAVALRLRSHGITRNFAEFEDVSEGAWHYEQIELGYNYRITDIQAALGLSQLTRLDAFVVRRRTLAARYDWLLSEFPVTRPAQDPNGVSAYHLYPICLKENIARKSRREVFDALRENGIGVNVHYIPVHTQPYYKRLGFEVGTYPNAENYYKVTLSLPLYATLTDEQQDYIVKCLKEILQCERLL